MSNTDSQTHLLALISEFVMKWNKYIEELGAMNHHTEINVQDLYHWPIFGYKSGSIAQRMTNAYLEPQDGLLVKSNRCITNVHEIMKFIVENGIDIAYFIYDKNFNSKRCWRILLKNKCGISACVANALHNYILSDIMDTELDNLAKDIFGAKLVPKIFDGISTECNKK
eukprot:134509_1